MTPEQTIQKLKSLVTRLRAEYAGDPNVQTVGWGLAKRGGVLEDGTSIVFFVKQKLPSDRSILGAGSKPIPSEIEGFKTDVQILNARPHSDAVGKRDETKFDPLLGGVATGNAEGHILWWNGWGTLGILATKNTDGTAVALSNWHVWGDGGSEGDAITQPAHPSTADHFEAIGKVAACGPLLTSLIEWTAPSPLTAGLYAGAAGAAIAAALSDYRDPTRRGQDHTPTNPGEVTLRETVNASVEYPNLPLPGVPFKTEVDWKYTRETNERLLTYGVTETNVNTQILLGKLVVTDKAHYNPGETVHLTAAIWDYQPRPCDGYHVVAHLIPHARPNTALRVVLHPSVCPRTFPQQPPDQTTVCIAFVDYKVGPYPYKGNFDWLQYTDTGSHPLNIVDWFAPETALQLSQSPLLLRHPPASKVTARVAQFTQTPVTMIATNAAGQIVDQRTAPPQQGVVHTLVLNGQGIVQVVVRGGGGEGLLISYCIDPIQEESFSTRISAGLASSVARELPELNVRNSELKTRRCCFTGRINLPPDEQVGKWDVHLTVQNINPVPEGTKPEQAAVVIGGHLLSSHATAQAAGCAVLMLLDHVFDVI